MKFMIVDTNSHDMMLGFNFFIKMGTMVDGKKCIIQIQQGPENNIQIWPLNMVNML